MAENDTTSYDHGAQMHAMGMGTDARPTQPSGFSEKFGFADFGHHDHFFVSEEVVVVKTVRRKVEKRPLWA
jgi:hypothetical protein